MPQQPVIGAVSPGDLIPWFISSANRDPENAAANAFDIRRDPDQHVAFGPGLHHCSGANWLRVESQESPRHWLSGSAACDSKRGNLNINQASLSGR